MIHAPKHCIHEAGQTIHTHGTAKRDGFKNRGMARCIQKEQFTAADPKEIPHDRFLSAFYETVNDIIQIVQMFERTVA